MPVPASSVGSRATAHTGGRGGPSTSYAGAAVDSPNIGFYRPRLRSVDAEIIRESPTLRARARDLVRNNPTAAQAVRISQQTTIGERFRLALAPDWRFLGVTHEQSVDWSRVVQRTWERYAHSIGFWCDAGRRMNFTELMQLVHDSDLVDGEFLIGTEWDQSRPWGTCFQLIDVDRLSNPYYRPDTVALKGGVELDRLGVPIGYHVRHSHPGDIALLGAQPWRWELIPRETENYRPVVLHGFRAVRAGQTRGVSEFSSVISALKMGGEYAEYELANAVVQAQYAMTIESAVDLKAAAEIVEATGWQPVDDQGNPIPDANPQLEMQLQAAQQLAAFYGVDGPRVNGIKAAKLAPGDKLSMTGSNHPNSGFDKFDTAMQRKVAQGLGVDPIGLTQNYAEGTSYSSSKSSAFNNGRTAGTRRGRLTRQSGMPMFAAWLEEAVLREFVPMPPGLIPTDFYAAREALCQGMFITAGKPLIEPLKERQAQNLGRQLGVETLASICSEEGLDWEENLEQIARENMVAGELGVVLGGMLPPMEEEPPADDPETKSDDKPKQVTSS